MVRRAVTVGDRSDWDRSLSFALGARATELAGTLPADEVEGPHGARDRDGTFAVDLDPLSLLCRLAASVPPPFFNSEQ